MNTSAKQNIKNQQIKYLHKNKLILPNPTICRQKV